MYTVKTIYDAQSIATTTTTTTTTTTSTNNNDGDEDMSSYVGVCYINYACVEIHDH